MVPNYFNTHRIKNTLKLVEQIVDMPSAKRCIHSQSFPIRKSSIWVIPQKKYWNIMWILHIHSQQQSIHWWLMQTLFFHCIILCTHTMSPTVSLGHLYFMIIPSLLQLTIINAHMSCAFSHTYNNIVWFFSIISIKVPCINLRVWLFSMANFEKS